ncbi:hypothetical protein MRX96_055821 [Rhipicephalus microplus]
MFDTGRVFATLLVCALLTDVASSLRSLRAKHVHVLNGRCIYRGRSVWEALHYPGRRKMRASPLQAQGTPAAFHPDEGMHASTCWKRMLL